MILHLSGLYEILPVSLCNFTLNNNSLFWLQCDWSDIWFHNLRVARKRRSDNTK